MKKFLPVVLVMIAVLSLCTMLTISTLADDGQQVTAEAEEKADNTKSSKAIAAAAVVGVVAAAAAVGMALAISKSTESMARQPEISDKINSAMMLGLVFIETAIIYALIVAILIVFVL